MTTRQPCSADHTDRIGNRILFFLGGLFYKTPSDVPPNIAPNIVTPENYRQIWDSSATLVGQLATVTIFGAILGGIPLSGAYPLNLVVFWADARKRY